MIINIHDNLLLEASEYAQSLVSARTKSKSEMARSADDVNC